MNNQKAPTPEHDKFKSGQGYGSAERGSDAQEHKSKRQFGDNPLPKSGGAWDKAGELQPDEDPEQDGMSAEEAERVAKKKRQDDALHS